MELLIDIGNSRLKWASRDHGQLRAGNTIPLEQNSFADRLATLWDKMPAPGRILVAQVGAPGLRGDLAAYCIAHWQTQPEFVLVEAARFGVTNHYQDIAQLGVDRWLAVVAAWQQHKGASCIVDCGTAVTIDCLDDKGVFTGGYIIPGITLMRQSLVHNTDQIQDLPETESVLDPGSSTAQCVGRGTVLSVSSAINQVVANLNTRYGSDLGCFITGGAATQLIDHLDRHFVFDPELVIEGLALYAGDS